MILICFMRAEEASPLFQSWKQAQTPLFLLLFV